jgi:hypothetical protein
MAALIKPNRAELAIIRACATAATRKQGRRLHRIEIGRRFPLDTANHPAADASTNVLLVDSTEHWEESDLFDLASWDDFRKGVPAAEGGRAVVDFYCYSREGLETNIQARFSGGRLIWTGIDCDIEPFTYWEAEKEETRMPAFELEKGRDGRPARTAPVNGAWPDNPRFVASGSYLDGRKCYAVEIRHGRDWSLTVNVWNKGRAVPENHLLHVRQAARDAYAEAFGYSLTLRINREPSAVYRPTKPEGFHQFESTGAAYDATQCREEIKNGDCLFIPEERVVGLAATWPVAITANAGNLHALADDSPIDAAWIKSNGWTAEQIRAAVRFAAAWGFEFEIVAPFAAFLDPNHEPPAARPLLKGAGQ